MNILSLILILTGVNLDSRVIDAVTGEPVPYVQITVLPEGRTLLTDSSGYFSLEFGPPSELLTLQLERIGYRTRVWTGAADGLPELLSLFPVAIPVSGVTSTATRLRTALPLAVPVQNRKIDPVLAPVMNSPAFLLSRATGILVNEYGNLTTLNLRGAGPEQTLVLWDRIRLNSSLNSLTDLTLLPPSQLERIEIARGGTSALYGTSALGGVINLITPEPRQRRLDLDAGLASFGTRTTALTASFPGPVSWLTSGEYFHSDNRFPYPDTTDSIRLRTNAQLSRATLLVKSQAALQAGQSLTLETNLGICRRGSPGPVTFPSDSARLDDEQLLVIAGYDLLESPAGRISARLYHGRRNERYHNPDPYFTASDTHKLWNTGINLNHEFDRAFGPVTCDLLTGVEAGQEQAQSTTVGSPTRLNAAGYIESGLRSALFQLSPALRYEILQNRHPDAVATIGALSPRLAVTLTPHPLLSFYSGVNRSFRAPSFNELFWPEDPWTRGNPHLKPEWGTGYDAGIGIKLPGGALRLTAFYSRIQDLIQWVADTSFVWQPVNIARVRIRGLELEPGIEFSRFGLDGNLTLQECRAESTLIPYRPPLTGSASIWLEPLRLPKTALRLQLSTTGATARFANSTNTDTLPGYLILDLGISLNHKINPVSLAISAGVQNLLDRHYELIRNYPLPGRSFYLKTRLTVAQ
ncbi:MAG: TonB-dependent receptor [candidate division WOR-3 bacterium]